MLLTILIQLQYRKGMLSFDFVNVFIWIDFDFYNNIFVNGFTT